MKSKTTKNPHSKMNITEDIRHFIIDELLQLGNMTGDEGTYQAFFSRVYPACKEIEFNHTKLINEIARHCDHFAGDWGDDASILEFLGIYDKWSDAEFLHFCQEYVSPVIRRTVFNEDDEKREDLQQKCVEIINRYLGSCGYKIKETKRIGDKITYQVVTTTGVQGVVKGIVFAAVYKPDVLLNDVLNHDVRIPTDDEKYLYYNQAIGNTPLTWGILQKWYDETHANWLEGSFTDRIGKAVDHCSSPIERYFYNAYLELHDEVGDNIPALLPQVWLYYDEKVQKDRIEKIFDHQCMDFMMLFSDCERIVIELDGAQHYSDEKIIPGYQYPLKEASPTKYASMVSAQRDMTLAGYEVYRFGGEEFQGSDNGKRKIKEFLCDLFEKHGIEMIR